MKRIRNFLKENKYFLTKVFVLFSISFLYLGRSLNGITPYPTGDGYEYIMTTEAILNHLTPDIRQADLHSFKEAYCKKNEWKKLFKDQYFDQQEPYFAIKKHEFLSTNGGIYTDRSGYNYSCHFFFYSMLNTPGRYIAEKVGADPLICFQVTNAVFVIIVCFFILFFTPFSLWKTVLISLAFCFSSIYWYLGWTHSEVYTISLVTLSFWFFLQNRHYLGIFLMALAGVQNQPLLIILLFMAFKTIFDRGFNIRNIFRIAASSIIFLWPPLFYYLHFGTTNLVKDAGFLSTEYITFTRVLGFYIDANQGVILAIPLVLLLYVYYVLRKYCLVILGKERFDLNYLLPVFLLVMTCIVCTMGNWNHAQAIVNRYASWFSGIILINVLFISAELKYIGSLIVLNYIFLTQTFTTLYHEQFNINDFSQDQHKPLAKWFLEEHPSLYNPDPQIFLNRTMRGVNGPSDSPIMYIKGFNEVTKIAVHRQRLDDLENYGFSKAEIEKMRSRLKYVNDWAYINRGDYLCLKSGSEIYQILRLKKLKIFELQIRSHQEWFKQVEDKAKMWGITTDEAVKRDAEYLLALEEEKAGKK